MKGKRRTCKFVMKPLKRNDRTTDIKCGTGAFCNDVVQCVRITLKAVRL